MKTVFVVSERDSCGDEFNQVAFCSSLDSAKDYIRGRVTPIFSKQKDGTVSASIESKLYWINEKEVLQ